jgi:hypothetical protein
MSTASNRISNPGSALGEAVGALIERRVHELLRPIAEENGAVYVSAGRINPKTGKATKLILKDSSGNEYNIDSVIANHRMQPLVLIESKYLRYKKHNRDKGSWICTAHYSLRGAYPTVRKSIAVLAGSWSGSSKAMMESFDVSLFEVSFQKIVEALANCGVDFAWEEKEKERAMAAWNRWRELAEDQYAKIAEILLADIEPALREAIRATLDETTPRVISEVEVTIETNVGESRRYSFGSIAKTIEFLNAFDQEEFLKDESGPSIWVADQPVEATAAFSFEDTEEE